MVAHRMFPQHCMDMSLIKRGSTGLATTALRTGDRLAETGLNRTLMPDTSNASHKSNECHRELNAPSLNSESHLTCSCGRIAAKDACYADADPQPSQRVCAPGCHIQ
jgi:hypothetical protein